MIIRRKNAQLFLLALFAIFLFACNTTKNAKIFKNYDEIFKFIEPEMEISWMKDYSLSKFKTDSNIQKIGKFDNFDEIEIIKTNYFKAKGYNSIRGAQDQGDYYIIGLKRKKYYLLGHIRGGDLKTKWIDASPIFSTYHHNSAVRGIEKVYKWDGKSFVLYSEIDYIYDSLDGTRKVYKGE